MGGRGSRSSGAEAVALLYKRVNRGEHSHGAEVTNLCASLAWLGNAREQETGGAGGPWQG